MSVSVLEDIEKTLDYLIQRLSLHLKTSQIIAHTLRNIKIPKKLQLMKEAHFIEEKLFYPVKRIDVRGSKIIGVDGGMQVESLSGLDVILVRAIAVMFYHKKERVLAKYFPEKNPVPTLLLLPSLSSRDELDKLATLKRLQSEYDTARAATKEFSPNIVLLDGSVMPLSSDKPQLPSMINEYKTVINLFVDLLLETERNKSILVGVVKDSRSRIFVNTLSRLIPAIIRNGQAKELLQTDYRSILRSSPDIMFLNDLIKPNERSAILREQISIPEHGITAYRDIIYLKPSPFDIPLRIEVLHRSEELPISINDLVGIIQTISGHNPSFALPTVLIEADARVKISNEEMELLIGSLLSKTGLSYLNKEKRRTRVPF